MNKWRMIKTQEGRHKKTSLEKYSPLTLLQGFERVACERMLETEHKLHILTPLLWPSCCVFIVLLMFNQRPWDPLHRGFSEVPLGQVWPSLPHLVSTVWNSTDNCIGGFPSAPSVGCGLPYHISSLTLWGPLATASGVSEVPLGRVWPSLQHLVSTVWNSTGNCSGTQTQLS